MTWRSATWARWLGWTVVLGLILWGGIFLSGTLPPRAPVQLFAVFLAPSLVLAFLIGLRFRSWWWVAAPLAAIWVPAEVFALARDPTQSVGEGVGLLVFGLLVASIVYCLLAFVGVWRGKHREEDDFPAR